MAMTLTALAGLVIAWWIGFAGGRRSAQGECRAVLEVFKAINEHNIAEVDKMERHITALQSELQMRKEVIWPNHLSS